MASKFFEHFLYIAEAINYPVHKKFTLWNEDDGFYYDMLEMPNGDRYPLKVHSMVGLIPLLAVTTFSSDLLDKYPGFSKRLEWFLGNREDLCGHVASMCTPGIQDRRILSIVRPDRLKRLLQRLFDETEFLSLYGIRSLSKFHEKHPFVLKLNAHEYRIDYEPAESTSRLFGGNSNWRGPVWFPLNMLIIESLQKFHHYFGDDFKIECPTGSGKWLNLWEASHEVASRLSNLFVKDIQGRRPMNGNNFLFQNDPFWKDYVLFYEYFNGDTGEGLGASHQTGWTGLVAKLIQQLCEYNTEVPSKCF
jgi:hypothetical protein